MRRAVALAGGAIVLATVAAVWVSAALLHGKTPLTSVGPGLAIVSTDTGSLVAHVSIRVTRLSPSHRRLALGWVARCAGSLWVADNQGSRLLRVMTRPAGSSRVSGRRIRRRSPAATEGCE